MNTSIIFQNVKRYTADASLTLQRGATSTARPSENVTCRGATSAARRAALSHSFDYISTT